MIDKNIFRKYDIRGTYNVNLNEDVSYTIGRAFGSYIQNMNEYTCLVGHDNRLSSNDINASLISGILSTGVNVIDLGLITTPMLYYARIYENIYPSIMITASHNPKDDNGFKMSFNNVSNAKGEEIYAFRDFLFKGNFKDGIGNLYKKDIKEDYFNLFKNTLHFGDRRLKVVIDCGNGVTSLYAKELYSMFNIDLISICDVSDGHFPSHHPDPVVEENLVMLKEKVKKVNADIGISFDGDGDRAGFVDELGNTLPSDHYAVIMIRELLKNNENKNILYDVKCSKIVNEEIVKQNGIPHEYRTGASYMMSKVIDDNMLFGIEYSGHIYFNNSFPPITSGFYAGLKLLEVMSKTNLKASELLGNVNKYYSTKEIKMEFNDNIKFEIINKVKEYALSKNYDVLLIDGVKVKFNDGWALIRCSNTGPNITLRFEANTMDRLEEIKNEFINLLNSYKM